MREVTDKVDIQQLDILAAQVEKHDKGTNPCTIADVAYMIMWLVSVKVQMRRNTFPCVLLPVRSSCLCVGCCIEADQQQWIIPI